MTMKAMLIVWVMSSMTTLNESRFEMPTMDHCNKVAEFVKENYELNSWKVTTACVEKIK